ncbi:class I SAM-dependent methyltransferase [bacterium]|nr:class I SAM-dependent methyltransferase [bacterium]
MGESKIHRYLDIEHVGPNEESVRKEYAPLLQYFDGCNNVLDVGCGRGILLEMLRERGINAMGCDSELSMVQTCLQKGFECSQTDVLNFVGGTDQKFDAICCGHLIEHLEPASALEFLCQCFDKLIPGGRLLIITPNPEDLKIITLYFWLDLTHVRPYPRVLLEKMLKHIGFAILQSHDSNLPLHDKNIIKLFWMRVIKWFIYKITRLDLLYRGNTVILASKP